MDQQQQLRLIKALLETLETSAKSDFKSKVWGSWPRLVQEFNELNEKARAMGVDSEIAPIQPVPAGHLSHYRGVGAGTSAELAKFSEVISAVSKLRLRIESMIQEPTIEPVEKTLGDLKRLCGRFHSVAGQLQMRHENRPTLDIKDEYDVQDLMHALLRIFFDDVRPEEWTPSYAGKSSRMDFLLKPERTVVETKKTRSGLGEKEISDQLIIDIERYRKHPDCKNLICLVYDPEHRIRNPRGFERDLSRVEGGMTVNVIVVPGDA